MVVKTSGNKIDTNLVASNIKSGVTIYGIIGTYSGGLLNVNLKPVHYKGINSIGPAVTNNNLATSMGGCINYNGSLWFFMYMETCGPGTGTQQMFMLELNLTTGVISEWINNTDHVDIYNGFSRYYEGNIVFFNEVNGNRHHSFDLANPTGRSSRTAGQHTTGITPTNSEIVGSNTFETLQYGLPDNQDSHSNIWYSGFFIS